MKNISIEIYDEKDKPLTGLIKINSTDLDFCYANSGDFHNLNSNYLEDDTYWHDRSKVLLSKIASNLRELIEIDKILNKECKNGSI